MSMNVWTCVEVIIRRQMVNALNIIVILNLIYDMPYNLTISAHILTTK